MVKQMNQDAIKGFVIFFFSAAYAVGIGYGELMFLQIVSKMFPTGAAGGFAMVGAVVAGVTALGMPIALHWWFSPGAQFLVGVLFYIVDLCMIGANAMLSYQMASGGPVDPLLLKWKEFCPATPIFCVAGLGLVFSFDISHKLRHAQIALRTTQIEHIARGMEQGIYTQEAQAYLSQVGQQAMWMAAQQLHGQALPMLPQTTIPDTATPMLPQNVTPLALPAPAPQKQGWFSRLRNGNGNNQMQLQLQALQQQLQQLQTNVPNEVTGKLVALPQPEATDSPLAQMVAMNSEAPLPTNGNGAKPA